MTGPLLKPASISLEKHLHQFWEIFTGGNLKEEMNVVRHEAVMVELGRIAFFRANQQSQKTLEIMLLLKEMLTVVASGDEMVTAVVHQDARVAGHRVSSLPGGNPHDKQPYSRLGAVPSRAEGNQQVRLLPSELR